MQFMPDRNQFGFGSNEWIISNAIQHAPQENKDATLRSLIQFLLHSETPYTANDVVDLITQGVLTGRYTPTVDMRKFEQATEPAEPSDDDLYPENDNPANSLNVITEEEIQGFMRRADAVLSDPDTGEPAPDPFEGWKIDDDA